MRLLRLLPSLVLRSSSSCRNDQGMVIVTRVGLRVSSVVKRDKPCSMLGSRENDGISSIPGWVGHGSGGCRLAGPPNYTLIILTEISQGYYVWWRAQLPPYGAAFLGIWSPLDRKSSAVVYHYATKQALPCTVGTAYWELFSATDIYYLKTSVCPSLSIDH